MIRFVIAWVFVSFLIWTPMNAKGQDPVEAMTQNLIFDDLNETQIDQIRQLFQVFTSRQQNVPTVLEILAQNREGLSEVISSIPFNRTKAQQIAQKAASAAEQQVLDVIELRNQIFHILTPEQQRKYIQLTEGSLSGEM
jgi:Spy/CpxP family protein refolding chaperone